MARKRPEKQAPKKGGCPSRAVASGGPETGARTSGRAWQLTAERIEALVCQEARLSSSENASRNGTDALALFASTPYTVIA